MRRRRHGGTLGRAEIALVIGPHVRAAEGARARRRPPSRRLRSHRPRRDRRTRRPRRSRRRCRDRWPLSRCSPWSRAVGPPGTAERLERAETSLVARAATRELNSSPGRAVARSSRPAIAWMPPATAAGTTRRRQVRVDVGARGEAVAHEGRVEGTLCRGDRRGDLDEQTVAAHRGDFEAEPAERFDGRTNRRRARSEDVRRTRPGRRYLPVLRRARCRDLTCEALPAPPGLSGAAPRRPR